MHHPGVRKGELTEFLIRAIVRLRGAELAGAPEAVADVREDLEQIVGPAVGRAASSRLLGVTQTALDRHIATGSLPVVVTPTGRREVPLDDLVRLMLEVDHVRGEAHVRPLSTALRERRRRAQAIDEATIMPDRLVGEWSSGDLRALAIHRAVADRLSPQMVLDARRRLRRWERDGRIDPIWARAWGEVLSLPLDEIRRRIASDRRDERDLRQSSPFAGVLDPQERRRVLDLVGAAT